MAPSDISLVNWLRNTMDTADMDLCMQAMKFLVSHICGVPSPHLLLKLHAVPDLQIVGNEWLSGCLFDQNSLAPCSYYNVKGKVRRKFCLRNTPLGLYILLFN